MITIKNYSDICGVGVGNDGHRIIKVEEYKYQYRIFVNNNGSNPDIEISLERIAMDAEYELWMWGADRITRRTIPIRIMMPKDDIKNKWILLEHIDELLSK
jgi:hypothetical protein